MNDGDWICSDPNCGNINFARRISCYRCNKERPDGVKPSKKKLGTEIGKSAAEKSRGLFNADDWQCNKCANVNWARRQTCNVCNAPKFGEVEARTGYGGGYNERGVVEYRRREPSSDDEYDEFGRKKRKRKSETQEKVGITEGPVNKKLPPTVLQKENKMDHVMQVPPNNMPMHQSKGREKVSGSLSDGSVCDLPPLTKVAFRRNQLHNQTGYHRQDHMLPSFKANVNGSRKRFASIGDRDHTGSSGYETGSKKKNELPVIKTYNPVMENRVSSTNNDIVYKFTGSTPAEDFQVTYTIEERVRAAAFAIVHNNCKISTTKFESLYDKPAPDFKTIFAWRQRLLLTGCLVDSHLEGLKKETQMEKTITKNGVSLSENVSRKKKTQMLPNPDEIPIQTDSDDEGLKKSETVNKSCLRQRSLSTETLLLGDMDGNIRAGGSVSTEEQESQARSHSASTRHRTRSSSRDSQDSNYPDTDSENMGIKNTKMKPKKNNVARSSIHESDSDSISYNSDDGDFLSRVFEDGRKIRRKAKRGSTPILNSNDYLPHEINSSFQGYSTVQQSEQSPLVTGNIYTSNLRNMNVKTQESVVLDTDGCSSEYVPTRLGSTAKKNYQEFRDSVKKKGYWAKGNGTSLGTNKTSTLTSVTLPSTKSVSNQETYYTESIGYVSAPITSRSEDFTKDEFDNFSSIDHYTPFDKPIKMTPRMEVTPENSTKIFDLVQSNSASKNRSIMDIFSTGDQSNHSPERDNGLEKYADVHKMYETEWDEDDDALYKNTDAIEIFSTKRRTPSPPSIGSLRAQSPMSKMLYTTDSELVQTTSKSNEVNIDFIKDKRDMLLDLLKDFQKSKEQHISENDLMQTQLSLTEQTPKDSNYIFNQTHSKVSSHLKIHQLEPQPKEITNDIMNNILTEVTTKPTSQELPKTISPSKRVHVLETITIKSNTNQKFPLDVSQNSMQSNSIEKQTYNDSHTYTKSLSQDTNKQCEVPKEPENSTPKIGQIDVSNLLASINTNTLLLALQNLQQMQTSSETSKQTEMSVPEQNNITENNIIENEVQHVETINLTNDEDWEKESNRDGSIERQLEKLDGNSGDTPFLSDIFDPGPVVMPTNVGKKLNINLKLPELNKTQEPAPHVNENAPVIGNFKSFALPKPILLNRLKLAVKPSEKHVKKSSDGKKKKRKKQGKTSASQDEEAAEEEDEEESGDDADLSKYDLWGSDGEQGTSSNLENSEKTKDKEDTKDGGLEQTQKNGKSNSPDAKSSSSRKRSCSSSSSSSSTSSSSSSHSSTQTPKNKFDDFNLNSEREGSPKRRKSRSRSRSPRSRSATSGTRRKSRDSRSAGESRSHESTRDKERSRDRDRRDRSRGSRDDRKERRYSRDGPSNHYGARGRHR